MSAKEMTIYTRVREIGRGGFGVVEEVADQDGRRFARKTFAPAASVPVAAHANLRKRFRREIITQQELGGTEILPVLDHGMDGADPWFVMPLADQTYQQKIAQDKANGAVDVKPLADILNGLQRLHDLGYVHRDLNPNNILLSDGVWKVSDLGSVLPPSGQTVTLTEDTIIYTERYCAPEQRQDFHNAQGSADVYSLGCILHDLYGTYTRTPYAQHSANGAIGVIIEKCTNHNPLKRPKIELLRTLVLDAVLEEGGLCAVEDEQASEWLHRLEGIEQWGDSDFEQFARFFANLDTSEKADGHVSGWVYSLSTPFLTRISSDAIRRIVERHDGVSSAIVDKYCDWTRKTAFEFNFSDNVCSRLTAIFDHGTPADKASAFAALVSLGSSHNRWYIMRCMLNRCQRDRIDSGLAKRLAIELKTEELEWTFNRCIMELKYDKLQVAPELIALCKY